MRLQAMYLLCKQNLRYLDNLEFKEEKLVIGGANVTYYIFRGWPEMKKALDNLSQVQALTTTVSVVMKTAEDRRVMDTLRFDQKERGQFLSEVSILAKKAETIIAMCESLGYVDLATEDYGFEAKLPKAMSLEESAECIKSLATFANRFPYAAEDEGKIVFRTIDIGSIWVTFSVVGTAALAVVTAVAYAVDKALVLRSHMQSVKRQKLMNERAEKANELIDKITQAYETVLDAETEVAISEIEEKCGSLDAEGRVELGNCLKNVAELFLKGIEIIGAISSNQETQALFPAIELQKLPLPKLALPSETKE